MHITEPTTMVTDYLLAGLGIYFALRLWQTGKASGHKGVKLWSLAFTTLALAALLGGTSHGFKLYLTEPANQLLWKATVATIGLANFFLLSGTIVATFAHPVRRWLLVTAGVKLALFVFWMAWHDEFIYVVLDYAPAMLAVAAMQIYAYVCRKAASAAWLIAGVLLSFVAAGVQVSGFSLHPQFNHNDLYHVVQMGGLYLLFRGVLLLQDR
ncbi:MAG: hypothetical protein ACE5IY_20480 [bacterium]